MKTINLLIRILCKKTCGMSLIGFDIPDKMELNSVMKEIVKENFISVDVEKVECIKNKVDNLISLECNIDNMPKAKLVLNYLVSNDDFMLVSDFYKKLKMCYYKDGRDDIWISL